jgi:RNA-directed DNA polymerase
VPQSRKDAVGQWKAEGAGVQWRHRWARIGNLLKLGVGQEQAVSTVRSSHGPWHLSRTSATKLAMPNDWLAQQGSDSFKVLWISLAQLR